MAGSLYWVHFMHRSCNMVVKNHEWYLFQNPNIRIIHLRSSEHLEIGHAICDIWTVTFHMWHVKSQSQLFPQSHYCKSAGGYSSPTSVPPCLSICFLRLRPLPPLLPYWTMLEELYRRSCTGGGAVPEEQGASRAGESNSGISYLKLGAIKFMFSSFPASTLVKAFSPGRCTITNQSKLGPS